MYSILPINNDLSDERFQELFKVRKEFDPSLSYTDYQSMKSGILERYKEGDIYHNYAVLDHNQAIVGDFSCYEDDGETENLGFVLLPNIRLKPEHVTDEIMTLIFDKLAELYDHTLKIRFYSENGLFDQWAEKCGGVFKIERDDFSLKYQDLNLEQLTTLAKESRLNNPDFSLKFCPITELTESELEEYLSLWNVSLGFSLSQEVIVRHNFKYQIPISSMYDSVESHKNGERKWYCVLLYDKNQQIAGISHIEVELKEPSELVDGKETAIIVDKGMTYISPKYQGNRFGRWVNCELYLKIDEYFKFTEIFTNMAPYNSYIQNINRDFGYKIVSNSSEKEYIFDSVKLK